jgi:hypothetical protein
METSVDNASEESMIEYLNGKLGKEFVHWILVDASLPLSPSRKDVAKAIFAEVRNNDQPDWSAHHLVHSLLIYSPQHSNTRLNLLRQKSGGQTPTPDYTGDDEVLSTLLELAHATYGEFLLSSKDPRIPLISVYNSPWDVRIREAIKIDPLLPFTTSQGTGKILTSTTAGNGGELQLPMCGPTIIGAAWEAARLREDPPSLGRFSEEIATTLSRARKSWNSDGSAIAAAAISGVALPEDSEMIFAWGRVRPARTGDAPFPPEATGDTGFTRDSGDIIIETSVPYRIRPIKNMSGFDNTHDIRSVLSAKEKVNQVRLAYYLAADQARTPAIVPCWTKIIQFMSQQTGYGEQDLHIYNRRSRIDLSAAEIEKWRFWILLLDSIEISKLGQAPTRLLRSFSERHDDSDILVDSVIVWESLFGAAPEITLRVSASVAKILRSDPRERRSLFDEAKSIYSLRSKLVHGSENKLEPGHVRKCSRRARQIAVEVLRALLEDEKHRDLINMGNTDRSLTLLLSE